ncbi:MAG: cobalamin-binding protein [Burkholderiaceae bacterium]|nr:cobalamin-binding protein [Burkholderiaceae bacterium]
MAVRTGLSALVASLLAFAAGAQAEIRLVDDEGATLVLPAPAQRIVSIAPHLTELLFAAGAGSRVVAVSDWSDYPEAARRLPRIGDAVRLDLERIVALKPDLVVVWANGSAPQQLARLRAAGLPVFSSAGRDLAHIAATLRAFGRLAGTDAAADARAAAFEGELAALRTTYAQRTPLRVVYQIWAEPLMTVNGAHPISEALALCGARNVFAELPQLVPQVSAEAVLSARPDAIVTGRLDAGKPDGLDRWRHLRSLQGTALLTVNPDTLHRATDRMAAGARELCLSLEAVRTRRAAGAPR